MTEINNAPLGAKATPVVTDTVPLGDDHYAQLQNLLKIISGLTEDTAPKGEDLFVTYDTSASGPKYAKLQTVLSLIPISGMMINGKIAPTVASNDLVLTLQTAGGATPSASDPVLININGTVRAVTAATSCTLADATNWFNAGGSELATKEIDYFAYAVWDSNSSVVAVAPARIPYACLVSDFSATSTNEKFIGNQSNYTSTDDVCVIGRFAATLSAGAGFTWTVPTFTSKNLIQRPIYETRRLTWVPVWTNLNNSTATVTANYYIDGQEVICNIELVWGASTAISGAVEHTLPMNVVAHGGTNGTIMIGLSRYWDSSASTAYQGVVQTYSTWNKANPIAQNASATYLTGTQLSSTVPMTWATSDEITEQFRYFMV